MERKTVLIIGGGVSGLTAGIYAEQHGFHAIVLEKNPSVGGLCTGWYRDGRYLDGCIHWLTGTKEGTDLNNMWKNVGALGEGVEVLQLGQWGTFEYEGQKVTFWSDLNKAEKEWINISPVDKAEIKRFFNMVKDVMSVNLPLYAPVSLMKFKDIIKLGFSVLDVWPSYLLTMKMSCEKYAKRFKSPAIRWAITHAQPGAGNLYSMIFCYATIASGNGGIPAGGSKPMVERMKNRFLSLGGTLKLNANVSHVLVEKKTAKGVVLVDGTTYQGDYVVSALDPHFSLAKLLRNQYSLPSFEKRYNNMKRNPTPSCCLFFFEGNDDPLMGPYSFECEPFKVGNSMISYLTVRNYNYDRENFVKDGKTIYTVLVDQYDFDYSYWNNLYKENPRKYRRVKEELARVISAKIIQKFPQFKGNLRVLDVSTPKTLNRYTNSSRGAYMGFLFTKRDNMYVHNGSIPGLKNFILAGQWMQCPGGLPLALAEGMFAIQRICKYENLSYAFLSAGFRVKKINS